MVPLHIPVPLISGLSMQLIVRNQKTASVLRDVPVPSSKLNAMETPGRRSYGLMQRGIVRGQKLWVVLGTEMKNVDLRLLHIVNLVPFLELIHQILYGITQ